MKSTLLFLILMVALTINSNAGCFIQDVHGNCIQQQQQAGPQQAPQVQSVVNTMMVTDPNVVVPTAGQSFTLLGSETFTKMNGGYSIMDADVSRPDTGGMEAPVFLYTDQNFPEKHVFNRTDIAVYVGEMEFGNTTIHAFKMVESASN